MKEINVSGTNLDAAKIHALHDAIHLCRWATAKQQRQNRRATIKAPRHVLAFQHFLILVLLSELKCSTKGR